jgi:isochorismate synthase EntC
VTGAPEPVPGEQPHGPLHSRTLRLDADLDPLGLAGPTGFAWLSGERRFVTRGVAARLPIGTGEGRLPRLAAAAAAALAEIAHDSETPPLAVGSIPFSDQTPGELVVPEVLVERDAAGGPARVTVTGDEDTVAAFDPASLAHAAARPPAWPRW